MFSKPTCIFALLLSCLTGFAGCAQLTEVAKTIWGSSTRALEEARIDAAKKTYTCSVDDCFQTVLSLTEEDESLDPPKERFFELFIKNRKKKHIVVMGVPGSVNTTEVGIFFVPLDTSQVAVEISSLSTNAKITVSERVFEELGKQYNEVQ